MWACLWPVLPCRVPQDSTVLFCPVLCCVVLFCCDVMCFDAMRCVLYGVVQLGRTMQYCTVLCAVLCCVVLSLDVLC